MTVLDRFLKKDVYHLVKYHWKQLLGVGIIVGFLLFLLNIFVGVSSYTGSLSDNLREKLGMYFYIKETPETSDVVYKKVINLQNDLQKQGLKVKFSSKEDAMKFLENRLPDISKDFEKFNIENPLPATLYVMFSSNREYKILKKTIVNYKDIISNTKDVDEGNTLQNQENRVLNVIDVNNFVVFLSVLIVVFLALIIFTFLGYQTYFMSQYLKKQLEIKTLLGGTYFDIIKEFVVINVSVLIVGFIVCLGLLILSWSMLSVSLYQLFHIGLLDIFASTWYVFGGFFIEIILFVLFSGIASFLVIEKLKK